jgi:beta-lactam-binding protein with PASTA domain
MLLPRLSFAILLMALPSYAQQAPATRARSTQQAAVLKPPVASMAAAQVPSVATPDFTGKTLDEVNALNVVPNVRARTPLFAGVLPQGDAGGVVISQSPAPKTPVYPGRSRLVVTLAARKPSLVDQILGQIVVTSPRRAIVPDVRNRTLVDATSLLRAARLTPASSGETSGLVAQQSPLPRASVDPGSSVQLTFTPPQSVVPSLYGLELNAAQASLERAYLRNGAITGDRVADVVSQSIQPGTQVPRGTPIDIAFRAPAVQPPADVPTKPQPQQPTDVPTTQPQATQPPTIQPQPPATTPVVPQQLPQVFVPDLTKLTRERAIDALTAVDLIAQPTDIAQPSGKEKGLVASQSPVAGTSVDAGSAVSFTLTIPAVFVPSVVGDPESNARARLSVFGLVAASHNAPDFRPGVPHFVVEQSPAANTEALVGATVAITIGNAAAPPPEPAWWQRLQPWVLPAAAVLLGLLGLGAWKLAHRPASTPSQPPLPAQALALVSRPVPSRIAASKAPGLRFTVTLRDHRPAAGRYTIASEPTVMRESTTTREPLATREPTVTRKG